MKVFVLGFVFLALGCGELKSKLQASFCEQVSTKIKWMKGPSDQGMNSVRVTINYAEVSESKPSNVEIEPYMTKMGHGTNMDGSKLRLYSSETNVEVWELSDFILIMGGEWQIKTKAQFGDKECQFTNDFEV